MTFQSIWNALQPTNEAPTYLIMSLGDDFLVPGLLHDEEDDEEPSEDLSDYDLVGVELTSLKVRQWALMRDLTSLSAVYNVEVKDNSLRVFRQGDVTRNLPDRLSLHEDFGGGEVHVFAAEPAGNGSLTVDLPTARISSLGVEFNLRPRKGDMDETRYTPILPWEVLESLYPQATRT